MVGSNDLAKRALDRKHVKNEGLTVRNDSDGKDSHYWDDFRKYGGSG